MHTCFTYTFRHGYGVQYQQEITDALAIQQARMDQASKEEAARRNETNRKRSLPDPSDEQSHSKKARIDAEVSTTSTTPGLNVLASFDFTTLPHGLVTDLVIANLVAVSQGKLDAAVQVSVFMILTCATSKASPSLGW